MANFQDDLKAVVTSLSGKTAKNWTKDGLPDPDVVYALLGSPKELEIGQMAAYIEWAAPGFTRDVAKAEAASASVQAAVEPAVVAEVELEDVEAKIDLTTATVTEIADEVAKAEEILAKAKARHAAAQAAQDAEIAKRPVVKDTSIMDYLERQRKNLEERAENLKFLRENHSLLKDVLKTKAPIDQALASRKRNSQ